MSPEEQFAEDVLRCVDDINNLLPHLAARYEDLVIIAALAEHVGGALRIFMQNGVCNQTQARRVLKHIEDTTFPREEVAEGNPPFVVGLLTAEDLVYVRNLLEAEESLQEESQHLPGEMPQGICSRIIVPTLDPPSADGPQVSPAQMERLSQYWSQIADETVKAECLDYAFITRCSELAALRLERKYNDRPKAQAINSQNLGSWVFLLER